MRFAGGLLLLLMLLLVSPGRAQDRFDSRGDVPRARVPVPSHTCAPSCKGLQDQWRAACGQPGTEHMARSMTVEIPGCPPCPLQCAAGADGDKGIGRSTACDGARGLGREECDVVAKPPADCEESGAKGIYRVECDPCLQTGGKGLARDDCRVPDSNTGPTPAPHPSTITRAIDTCLGQSGLAYYTPPRTVVRRGGVSYDPSIGTVGYDGAFIERQSPYLRAFWLGEAFSAHVVNLERQRFGVARTPAQVLRIRDYLTGYLTRCLVAAGVLDAPTNRSPNDPRILYARYLREGTFALPGDPQRSSDIADWVAGWGDYGMGVRWSLRHDPRVPPPPGDPFGLRLR